MVQHAWRSGFYSLLTFRPVRCSATSKIPIRIMEAVKMPNLLLLPVPSEPPSRRSLARAYATVFAAVLERLKDPARSSSLMIAAVGPFLGTESSEHHAWSHLQSILAGIYSLISYICAQESIATDINAGPGAVDTRVILVDENTKIAGIAGHSIVWSLPDFAMVGAPWNLVFYPEIDNGRELLEAFLSAASNQAATYGELIGLDIGDSHLVAQTQAGDGKTCGSHGIVCLGGTFDHLHPGHKLLLSAAALLLRIPPKSQPPCRFIIGVTGDELLKNKKFAEYLQPWQVRAAGVIDFLESVIDGPGNRGHQGCFTETSPGSMTRLFRAGAVLVECVEIQDAFGPTITREDMDALVVSGETRSGGQAVNERRADMGWRALEIYEVDVLDAKELSDSNYAETGDFAAKISSTAIREHRAVAAAGTTSRS